MGHTPFESGQSRGMVSVHADEVSWLSQFISSVPEKRGFPAHQATEKENLNFRFKPLAGGESGRVPLRRRDAGWRKC
jgi:hypothetical protein